VAFFELHFSLANAEINPTCVVLLLHPWCMHRSSIWTLGVCFGWPIILIWLVLMLWRYILDWPIDSTLFFWGTIDSTQLEVLAPARLSLAWMKTKASQASNVTWTCRQSSRYPNEASLIYRYRNL
jgi:hypothetical protein